MSEDRNNSQKALRSVGCTHPACKVILIIIRYGVTQDCFIYILDNSNSMYIAHLHFELVSCLLALEATELVSEPVTQMAIELYNIHLISIQQKRCV